MKVFVTGNAGSGKSTLSKELGKKLRLPVFSLDKVVWKPGWNKPTDVERKQKISKLLKKNSWIIDGVSTDILKAADTVIFLDFPRKVCYLRVIKRSWRYLFKSRPELPDNCPEILILKQLFKIIWYFPIKVRPQILQELKKPKNRSTFYIHSNAELQHFLNTFEA